eukprot:gnl/TRDRNA2_/TRDRNA2_132138_c0_seq1.p1 gnl/TRDRNA2_/TRDRNA2_132138_c0~~gnl/TRDRNA2_/TRDRNA2_132138_c0_seq1.p1  ORF type:complete len:457 (-),score=61.94 gnl/TRDRNA2_/TRDRNA2_132138_c0_seq1:125-1309(-)
MAARDDLIQQLTAENTSLKAQAGECESKSADDAACQMDMLVKEAQSLRDELQKQEATQSRLREQAVVGLQEHQRLRVELGEVRDELATKSTLVSQLEEAVYQARHQQFLNHPAELPIATSNDRLQQLATQAIREACDRHVAQAALQASQFANPSSSPRSSPRSQMLTPNSSYVSQTNLSGTRDPSPTPSAVHVDKWPTNGGVQPAGVARFDSGSSSRIFPFSSKVSPRMPSPSQPRALMFAPSKDSLVRDTSQAGKANQNTPLIHERYRDRNSKSGHIPQSCPVDPRSASAEPVPLSASSKSMGSRTNMRLSSARSPLRGESLTGLAPVEVLTSSSMGAVSNSGAMPVPTRSPTHERLPLRQANSWKQPSLVQGSRPQTPYGGYMADGRRRIVA